MTTSISDKPEHWALLVLPRVRVQNANAISSPMTWGFPAITAFLGLMTGLERRLGPDSGICFKAVGVVCHDFEAQIVEAKKPWASSTFRLTRNPVGADGSTAGIVEEGRVHLELTLVFSVQLSSAHLDDAERQALAGQVAHALAGMRLAGGSVMPPLPGGSQRRPKPFLELEAEGDASKDQLRKLARACLPGFALVSRHDLLTQRLADMKTIDPQANVLEAWLDLSRWNHRAGQTDDGEVTWQTDKRPGWTVPIPVGYTALSELHAPGTVAGARDAKTPFRFVETIWSMGQWISPHRLKCLDDLFWYARTEGETQATYRCCNKYTPDTSAEAATV